MIEQHVARKLNKRLRNAAKLIDDFELQRDAEFFQDSHNRLEFIGSLEADDFLSVCQHVNARLRSSEPRDRKNVHDSGGSLPLLGTPDASEKRDAFESGFNAIKAYLSDTNDSDYEKIRGVTMATEALIIWVHPFNDGNGRTSRFLGKFIENGATDTEQLIKETADGGEHLRMYGSNLRVDTHNTIKDIDIIWDDGELEEIERTTGMPVAEGISSSLKRLLGDKKFQDSVDNHTQALRDYKEKMSNSKVVA